MNNTNFQRGLSVIWLLGVTCILSIYLLHKFPITNEVEAHGDAEQYQTIAVNLLDGHGYVHGFIKPNAYYRILEPKGFSPEHLREYNDFMSFPDYKFRTLPGYPIFLATIYAVFGNNPIIPKGIQILLYAFSLAILPLLGHKLWKRYGFVCGLLTIAYTISFDWPIHVALNVLLTEGLQTFSLILAGWFYAGMVDKNRRLEVLYFSFWVTVSVMIKGTAIFLFPLGCLLVYIKFYKAQHWKMSLLFLVMPVFFVVTWSSYASIKSGRLVILDKQHENMMAYGHNHPEEDLTNEKDINARNFFSAKLVLISDYINNPEKIVKNNYYKLVMFKLYFKMPLLLFFSLIITLNFRNRRWFLGAWIILSFFILTSSVTYQILYGSASLLTIIGHTYFYNHVESKLPKIDAFYLPLLYLMCISITVVIFYPKARYVAPFTPMIIWAMMVWPTIFISSIFSILASYCPVSRYLIQVSQLLDPKKP